MELYCGANVSAGDAHRNTPLGRRGEAPVPYSSAVAQYLPFLRRYARALTGNQASGDAYVAATLEALIADRSIGDDPRGARVALYRLFTKIWNSVAVNGIGPTEGTLPGEQKLAN